MSDEEYKISTLIRDAVFDSGDKSSIIGHYAHKAREIIEEARADERAKVLKAVIDCGWHCEVHSDKALYDMVEIELREAQNDEL